MPCLAVCCFRDRISWCSPGYSPALASGVLWLQVCTTLPGKMASFSASKNVQKGVIGRTEKRDGKTNYVFILTTTNNYWQMFTISTVLANVYHIHGGPPISLLLPNNYQWLISFCLVSSHCSSVLESDRSVVFFLLNMKYKDRLTFSFSGKCASLSVGYVSKWCSGGISHPRSWLEHRKQPVDMWLDNCGFWGCIYGGEGLVYLKLVDFNIQIPPTNFHSSLIPTLSSLLAVRQAISLTVASGWEVGTNKYRLKSQFGDPRFLLWSHNQCDLC